tara:strand:- start:242 stop:649 length:408 start_codon:yes stop_codon:yes gene_type:complete
MPKKEKVWTIGMPKGPIGPFVWQVWVKGSQKPIRVVAFDLQHIKNQLQGKAVIKAQKEKEKKESFGNSVPLGPKGYKGSSRPADLDAGFKVLRQWVDENGGPPEEIRQKLRELWIDYDRAPRKTTRSSAKKKGRY